MIDRGSLPTKRRGYVRYTYPGFELCAIPFIRACAFMRPSTHTHLKKKKKNQANTTKRSAKRVYSRMADGLSTVLTLFFYRRGHDVRFFHSFQIAALKAPLPTVLPPFPIVSLSLPLSFPSSLCMQPHFPLDWNAPNRSFFLRVSPFTLIWQLVGVRSFVYTAQADRDSFRIYRARQKPAILEKRECGLKEARRNWEDR